jgi:uncharacterized protein YcgL (UPF0745 family)
MQCAIYKGSKKADSYLFVLQEDDFSSVPEPLLELLGVLEFVMTLELNEDRTLAQADPVQVMQLLETQGYFLQIPPTIESLLQ